MPSDDSRMTVRTELEYFFGAIRFFTRLPVPGWVGHSSEALERSSRYFPAVGLIVGGIAALVFVLSSLILPKTLAVLASMASTLYVTGAFHEDGWSDMVDGFGGGWDKPQILTIMKAVSYTHLDVYKRQALDRAEKLRSTSQESHSVCSKTPAQPRAPQAGSRRAGRLPVATNHD